MPMTLIAKLYRPEQKTAYRLIAGEIRLVLTRHNAYGQGE